MDKETLSNYGWIVVCVMVLAVLLALASPFGTFVAGAIKSTTAGLFSVNQAALGSAGIDVNDMVFENCDHLETEIRNATDTYTGDTCCKACGAVLSAGQTVRAKVPAGGLYTAFDGTVYNPGDELPEVVTTGDKYTYEDYEYAYNMKPSGHREWTTNESQNGWGVDTILNDKEIYGEILKTINDQPITSLNKTFAYCSKMTAAPEIPTTVTNLAFTFGGCNSLVDLSSYTIPDSVTDMKETFRGCYALTKAPAIPKELTSLNSTFEGCSSLTREGLPVIHENITSMEHTFDGCKSLVDLGDYVIPETVRFINYIFSGCTSLTTAPIINVEVAISGAFNGCTALTGTVTIVRQPTRYYTGCFQGVDFEKQNLTLTGDAEYLDFIGATGINYCTECNGKCTGGHE